MKGDRYVEIKIESQPFVWEKEFGHAWDFCQNFMGDFQQILVDFNQILVTILKIETLKGESPSINFWQNPSKNQVWQSSSQVGKEETVINKSLTYV